MSWPNSNRPWPVWSEEERDTLTRLVGEGVPVSIIAAQLGRSVHAVNGRMTKSGLFYARVPRESFKDVVAEVSEKSGVAVRDMLGPSRVRPIARARQEAMWAVRTRCLMSYPRIGQRFGGRDHTTAMHAVKVVERRMAEAGAQ